MNAREKIKFSSKDLQIVFEDKHLLVINKPSGLASQGMNANQQDNLYDLLKRDGRWTYIGMHQRLDLPTSGLILFTLKKEVNEPIAKMFREHQFEKTYACLCYGVPATEKFSVKNQLMAQRLKTGKNKVRSVLTGGDSAETDFKLLKSFAGQFSLLEAKPKTGRMHQIRVHLSESQLPILGDALYFRADRKFPRLMLHALKLSLQHPVTKQNLLLEASFPEDFLAAEAKLAALVNVPTGLA